MNRQEYMAALRRALSVLPDEERANALRYYEEYFDDAGMEHEQNVIEDLGPPEQVAVQILADYRDLIITASANNNSAPPPPPAPEPQTQTRRGISPAALILLVLLAIPIGIPLAFALFAAVVGILFGGLGILLALAVTILAIPFCVLFAGIAFSAFSFVLWATPASALVTLGSGLALIAVGILLGVLVVKLCILFVPPLTRGFIAILRWPIDKLRNRNQGGTPS